MLVFTWLKICTLLLLAIHAFAHDHTQTENREGGARSRRHILAVLPCYRGHLNPASGIIRALIDRGSDVTVFMVGFCRELVKCPGVKRIIEDNIVSTESFSTSVLNGFIQSRTLIVENGTTRLFYALDKHLSENEGVYDLIFSDMVLTAASLAGHLRGIHVVSQFIGPLLPSGRIENMPLYDQHLFATENPNEPAGMREILSFFLHLNVWDSYISSAAFYAINDIRRGLGLAYLDATKNTGMAPYSITQRMAFFLAHGAEPISSPSNVTAPNTFLIGFKPDAYDYPEFSSELAQWLDRAEKPVVYMSLGTVLSLEAHVLNSMLAGILGQDELLFVWAVRNDLMLKMGIYSTTFVRESLFLSSYLPQGRILGHDKVKLFVTHCGANSVQDGIYATKPMITYPGMGDQPRLSNTIVGNGVGFLLQEFEFKSLKTLATESMRPETYTRQTKILGDFRKKQIELGGYEKGTEYIERIIDGEIKFVEIPEIDFFSNTMKTPIRAVLLTCLSSIAITILYTIYTLIVFIKSICSISD